MPLQRIVPSEYASQLKAKIERFQEDFACIEMPSPRIFPSAPLHYRLRAEFRIYHSGERVDYAMFAAGAPRSPIVISDFPVAAERISVAMPQLRDFLQENKILKDRLFQVNFLSTLSGELLVTMIYHRRLDSAWEQEARSLAMQLNAQLIGRSQGQKIVLDRDWLLEEFSVGDRPLRYQQVEGSFTQPNGGVNREMLAWACEQVSCSGGDMLELYCGNGNFTIALAPMFDQVFATEISKSSVKAAQYNIEANAAGNIRLARMSSDEISCALAGERRFNRLKDIDLEQYRFTTLFVDPPRSGLDGHTVELARRFDRILYISCNPESLRENVVELQETHAISSAALFDQFPYTDHLECGLLLRRRQAV
jgi:tRNA (uracil-5-)-methyltransferase